MKATLPDGIRMSVRASLMPTGPGSREEIIFRFEKDGYEPYEEMTRFDWLVIGSGGREWTYREGTRIRQNAIEAWHKQDPSEGMWTLGGGE